MSITTAQEVIAAISEAVEIGDLPQPQKAVWFPPPGFAAPTTIDLAKDVPFDPNSVVIGIFHDEDEIRIYSLGKAAPTPAPAGWKPSLPTRYVLTRTAPTYVSEAMSMDTMAEEMIDEWNRVASAISSAEVEREAVIAWLAGFGDEALPQAPSLIQELRDEVHLQDDDDDLDEPDDTEADPTAAPAVPVVASAPPAPAAPPVSP